MRVAHVERRRDCGCGCGTILALLIGIGPIFSTLGIGQKPRRAEQSAPQEQAVDLTPVVDKDTHYEVTRVDVRRGILGNTVALDGKTSQMVGSVEVEAYAVDGSLLIDLSGREDGKRTRYTFYLMPPLE